MVKTGTSAPADIEEDNLSAPGLVMFMAGIVSIVVIISLNVRNVLTIVCSPPHVRPSHGHSLASHGQHSTVGKQRIRGQPSGLRI